MHTTISRRNAFFSIERLAQAAMTDGGDTGGEMIEMYLVLSGGIIIGNGESGALLTDNNLYWVRHDGRRRLNIDEGTEGYVIRFSKTFLQQGGADLNCSYRPAYCPWPPRDEITQFGDVFLTEGKALCDRMCQAFEGSSYFKMNVIGDLLRLFLFHLIRKSKMVMYIQQKSIAYDLYHR